MGKNIRCKLISPPIRQEESIDIVYPIEDLPPDIIQLETTVRYKYVGSQDGIRFYRKIIGGVEDAK